MYEWLRPPKVYNLDGTRFMVIAELGARNAKGELRACRKIYRYDFILPENAVPSDELALIGRAFLQMSKDAREGKTWAEGAYFTPPAPKVGLWERLKQSVGISTPRKPSGVPSARRTAGMIARGEYPPTQTPTDTS